MEIRGMDVLGILRGLKAYDEQENLFGTINGPAISDKEPNEPWVLDNTILFVGSKEIYIRNVFIKKYDIKEQISKWTTTINQIKQEILQEEDAIAIEYLAKKIVGLCQKIQILEEYEKNVKEKIIN